MGDTFPRPFASYVLLERLGSGGMSEVDLARRIVDDGSFVRFAVIKRIKADRTADASFVRMFKDEARITSELHHEKIGSVYDFGKVGDEYYLALEYVPGIDCRHLVNTLRERGQRVPVKVALKIVVDVLEALHYAHFKKDTFGRPMGIVHRDVNPRNVMLSIRGEVKLIDFGVAKATDRLERTRTDHVKGKFAYMAPEQISGLAVDHRTDLYAVGLMLHELLTGISPFAGLNQVQILHRMVNATVEPLPPVPELPDDSALRRAHALALASDPNDRYATAADFAADLRAVAEPIGGLPTDDQLAIFLGHVDPDLTGRLERKMEDYARLDTGGVLRAFPHHQPEDTLGDTWNTHGSSQSGAQPWTSGTGSRSASGKVRLADGPVTDSSGTLLVSRTGMLAGSVMLVSLVSALAAAGLVLILLVAVYAAMGGFSEVPGPETLPNPEPTLAPKPLEIGLVKPEPGAPDPVVPDPAPAVPVRPRPAPDEPVPAEPDPDPNLTPVPRVLPAPDPVVPDPVVPLPDPVVLPDPIVPDPLPVPRPSNPDLGFLSVTAPEKGLPVKVNGEQVGVTALARHRIPVGTYTIEVPGYTCPRPVLVKKDQVANVACK